MQIKDAAFFKKIGRKGGKARLVTMTAEERSEAAKRSAETRWRKKREQP